MGKQSPLNLRRLRFPDDLPLLRQAWEWTQARPQHYPATGGQMSFERYAEAAQRIVQSDFGYFVEDQLHCLVTVEAESFGKYNFHLTSQPHPDFKIITTALYTVGVGLFRDLGAKQLYTWIPRLYTRNRRVAKACGMQSIEHIEKDGIQYEIFGVNRAYYLSQFPDGQ